MSRILHQHCRSVCCSQLVVCKTASFEFIKHMKHHTAAQGHMLHAIVCNKAALWMNTERHHRCQDIYWKSKISLPHHINPPALMSDFRIHPWSGLHRTADKRNISELSDKMWYKARMQKETAGSCFRKGPAWCSWHFWLLTNKTSIVSNNASTVQVFGQSYRVCVIIMPHFLCRKTVCFSN